MREIIGQAGELEGELERVTVRLEKIAEGVKDRAVKGALDEAIVRLYLAVARSAA